MPEPTTEKTNRLETLGKAMAAVLTIAILVVVGWQFSGNADSGNKKLEPNRGFDDASIESIGENSWRITCRAVVMEVHGKPVESMTFSMRPSNMLDEHTRPYIRALRRLTRDPHAAALAGVSDAQMKELETVELPRMVVSEEDRANLASIWATCNDPEEARRVANEKRLFDALSKVGQSSIEPTKKAWEQTAADVKQILSFDQLAKLSDRDFGGEFRQMQPGVRFEDKVPSPSSP